MIFGFPPPWVFRGVGPFLPSLWFSGQLTLFPKETNLGRTHGYQRPWLWQEELQRPGAVWWNSDPIFQTVAAMYIYIYRYTFNSDQSVLDGCLLQQPFFHRKIWGSHHPIVQQPKRQNGCWTGTRPGVCVCVYIYIYLREPQHTPGAYPRHPQTLKWKEFHKQMVEGLGYVPGVCWKILWIYAYYTLPETNTAPDTKCLEYDPFLLKKTLVQQGRNSLLVSGSVLISISCLSVWSFQLPLL